jgi:hypothetical protein
MAAKCEQVAYAWQLSFIEILPKKRDTVGLKFLPYVQRKTKARGEKDFYHKVYSLSLMCCE